MSAKDPPERADWVLSLSQRQNSCLRFPPIEPCVNKAVSHLRTIKKRITERQKTTAIEVASQKTSFDDGSVSEEGFLLDSRTTTPKPILKTNAPIQNVDAGIFQHDSRSVTPKPVLSQRSGVSIRDPDPHAGLCVEGVPTGTVVKRNAGGMANARKQPATITALDQEELQDDWLDARSVITGAIDLVGRLERDWQETVQGFEEEKERVRQLQGALDMEAERRLNLLPRVVQAGKTGVGVSAVILLYVQVHDMCHNVYFVYLMTLLLLHK